MATCSVQDEEAGIDIHFENLYTSCKPFIAHLSMMHVGVMVLTTAHTALQANGLQKHA